MAPSCWHPAELSDLAFFFGISHVWGVSSEQHPNQRENALCSAQVERFEGLHWVYWGRPQHRAAVLCQITNSGVVNAELCLELCTPSIQGAVGCPGFGAGMLCALCLLPSICAACCRGGPRRLFCSELSFPLCFREESVLFFPLFGLRFSLQLLISVP